MKSTIDAAGRVVIPKAIRAAARLEPGTRLQFRVTSAGVLEIEPELLEVEIQKKGRLTVAQPRGSLPMLKQAQVDSTLAELRADTANRR
ncbi:MAG: AbrB/MazE/SpoVT family DNA-binding domain-containing protein [Bryobacterales bacterium]|nr:AbrB/MazE/SpoVT family DNA-binding domain-containing protein [Bryobacterales bacterium]